MSTANAQPDRTPTRDPVPLMAAAAGGILLAVLCGFLGVVWDVMWHTDVGPDTFLTLPHLLMYTGTAGAGLVALATVLVATRRARDGEDDGASVPLLRGTFHGPLPVVVVGWGAVLYLVAGLYDQWWHRVYGFDAVLDSPPHIALGLGDLVIGSGLVLAFAVLMTRLDPRTHPRPLRAALQVGFLLAVAVFLANTATYQVSLLGTVLAGVDLSLVFVAVVWAFLLVVVHAVLRRPWAATRLAATVTALCAIAWLFAVRATGAYADALGLAQRENAVGYPEIIAVLPRFVLPAAVVLDVGLLLARRRGASVRVGVAASAAAAMGLLVLLELALPGAVRPSSAAAVLAAVAAAAIGGAAGGTAGWNTGVLLRRFPGAAPRPTASTTGAGR